MRHQKCIEIDYFLLGVSKSATTWIYQCFKDHPDVFVPSTDSLKYFDLKYHKGKEWYWEHFSDSGLSQVVVDPSPTYLRSPVTSERIANDYPNAKFILSLRNPVDRAFSQFWHEKKANRFDYAFKETADIFLLYTWYIETGFYATHLKRFLQYFDKSRFKIILFDNLTHNPETFISEIYEFLMVDRTFSPPVLNKKINAAGIYENKQVKAIRRFCRMLNTVVPPSIKNKASKTKRRLESLLSNKDEYDRGIDDRLRQELLAIYLPEINKLEALTGLDLAAWKC